MFLFTASDVVSITSFIHNWVLFLLWLCLFFLELFLHWSPVAYWAPTNLESSSFSVLSFCLFILFMAFSRQEYWSGLPFPAPVTTFCQNSPPWPVHLGWCNTAWLIVSLSWTRLWSMWLDWIVFCDCGFHCVCPLMDKDKRLMEASWWEGLTEGETGSFSDGQDEA